MSFSHLHEALKSHVQGELLPDDVQRWLASGLAAFVDGQPLAGVALCKVYLRTIYGPRVMPYFVNQWRENN